LREPAGSRLDAEKREMKRNHPTSKRGRSRKGGREGINAGAKRSG